MDLEALYRQIEENIGKLDFERIWPGFRPLKFALFDDGRCFFDGRWVEKTEAFCANTSIVYQGEQIATWKAEGERDLSVLSSKLVHEMFHGFQRLRGWDCWPDELEALFHYAYRAENLSLRLRENELLLTLLEHDDLDALRELLSHRKRRSELYPYEFSYESRAEEIEGTANYVEWHALRQLDAAKAEALTDEMRETLTKPERLFPIRISCYMSGALLIHALLRAGLYAFDPPARPASALVLADAAPSDGGFPGREACCRRVSEAIAAFRAESASIVRVALERNELVLSGPLELAFVNIYDAWYYEGFLTSRYFVMYKDGGENRMLPGNFVIRMQDEKTIAAVYRWP